MSEVNHPENNPLLIDTVQEPRWDEVYAAIDSLHLPAHSIKRADYVAHWTALGIARSVTLLHSVLAPNSNPVPSDERRTVSSITEPDSQSIELVKPEARYSLFEKAQQGIGRLSKEAKINPEAFLERSAYVIAAAIVLAHPFEDGNGRTSRVFAHVIRNGFEKTDYANAEEIKLIGKNRPANGYRVNSFTPATESLEMATVDPDKFLGQIVSAEIPLSKQSAYLDKISSILKTPYT